jgi:hypothetical protein
VWYEGHVSSGSDGILTDTHNVDVFYIFQQCHSTETVFATILNLHYYKFPIILF